MNYRWDQPLAERRQFPLAVAAVCVLATLFSSQPVFAGSCPVFGPQTYERPTGAPTTVLTVFSAANTTVSYVLQLYNGGLTDAEFDKVSSTTISVNGTQVVAPNDLNQNMAYLEKAVTLSSTNQMTVQVRGKPGGAIVLKIVTVDDLPPVIVSTVTPGPNAAGWNNSDVTVSFTCTDAVCGIASCPAPIRVSTEGADQTITATATDMAGNSASAQVSLSIDKTPPVLTAVASPVPNENGWNKSDVTVRFTCTDALSGVASCPSETTVSSEGRDQVVPASAVDAAGNSAMASLRVSIDKTPPVITSTVDPAPNGAGWNKTDATVTFGCADTLSGVASCPPPRQITTEGQAQGILATAADRAGNSAIGGASVSIDKTPPLIQLTAPVDGTVQRTPLVRATGTVTEANAIATITVNGVPMGTAPAFGGDVPLQIGPQVLTASAEDVAGNVGTASATVTYVHIPVVKITSPANLAAFGTSPSTVTGTVDDPQATVIVGIERVPAVVSGTTFTATGVHLNEGGNVVTAVATDAQGNVGTDSVTVVLDTVAPRVLIDSPTNGAITPAATVAVSGRVSDIVMGTINSGQAHVRVNGIEAVVSNRTFLAEGVPLNPGANTVTAVATDAVGNSDTKTISLNRQTLPSLSLVLVSGDAQSAAIEDALSNPLVVRAADAGGQPLVGRVVVFRVVENSGSIADSQGHQGRALSLTTDAEGKAQVRFTLGSRAGVGNNRVEATVSPRLSDPVLSVPPVTFIATGIFHPPAKINVDSGGGQKGIVGQALPRPFVAVITDDGHNRLANVPVTFTVVEGGGILAGLTEVTVNTDSDGRAVGLLTLGSDPGIENNTVTASVPNLSGLPAVFKASGLDPGAPAQTRISGVVLDNTNAPIRGVTLRVRGTATSTSTDDQGYFTLAGVPTGDVHLMVDGSTAQRPGTWPDLEYEVVMVPGANNTLGMPIYLLPLDTAHAIFVDETHGGTLTLADYPGFSLTVSPNSATFPDGTRRGTVSVTVVHADKVPMVPNFGQQPRFIVTIQPPGVRFDPPAQISHPNVDALPPGQVTELYSFDHDMGSFVATATATVSEDGLVLRSDPGTGIIKGGWHCGGNPNTSGTVAKCPECARCDGSLCRTDYEELGRCCFGQKFDDQTECCHETPPSQGTMITTGTVVPKNPIGNLADCPARLPRGTPGVLGTSPDFHVLYDGCTDVNNNPAGAPDTEFSTLLCRLTGINGNCTAACDWHDRCYQTCNSPKASCDSGLLNIALATCDASSASLLVKLNCRAYAHDYYEGVSLFGQSSYDADQKQVCKCCP